ncbi:hypothetical protein [Klebsiella grimontii]|uniref:hypothetical protein n=1 Tax=Klebsiella grimontii TaxID=2058152 RepID=UPI0022446ABE|nr:hypothetical protein [Klebsiella grimontii]
MVEIISPLALFYLPREMNNQSVSVPMKQSRRFMDKYATRRFYLVCRLIMHNNAGGIFYNK